MKTDLHALTICSVYSTKICRRLHVPERLSTFPPLIAASAAIMWVHPIHKVSDLLVPFSITTATMVSEKILVPQITKMKTSLKKRGQILRAAQLGVFGVSSALVFGGLAYTSSHNVQKSNSDPTSKVTLSMQNILPSVKGEAGNIVVSRPGSQAKSTLPHYLW